MKTNQQKQTSNPVKNQSVLDDFAKLAHKLQTWEAQLTAREDRVGAALALEVLDQKLEFKQRELEDIEKQITKLKHTANLMKVTTDNAFEEAKKKFAKIDHEHKKTEALFIAEQRGIDEVRAELKKLNQEISERRAYQIEQENIIAAAVEDGNMQLKSLQYQIADVEESKKTIERQLYDLNQEKNTLVDDVTALKKHVELVQHNAEIQKESLEAELDQMRARLASKVEQFDNYDKEFERKQAILREREEGIIAKQAALHKERAEFTLAKRRFEAKSGLYE